MKAISTKSNKLTDYITLDNFCCMPTIRTVNITDKVKVAVRFELDQIRPVWFQIAGQKPVEISQICAVWYCTKGEAKIINFEIWGEEKYSLEYNTQALSWSVGRTVIE